MHKMLLSSVLILGLVGCSHQVPKVTQVPAGQLVDKEIVDSVALISLAQTRLHQTSAARSFTPVSVPVISPAKPTPSADQTSVRPVPISGG